MKFRVLYLRHGSGLDELLERSCVPLLQLETKISQEQWKNCSDSLKPEVRYRIQIKKQRMDNRYDRVNQEYSADAFRKYDKPKKWRPR